MNPFKTGKKSRNPEKEELDKMVVQLEARISLFLLDRFLALVQRNNEIHRFKELLQQTIDNKINGMQFAIKLQEFEILKGIPPRPVTYWNCIFQRLIIPPLREAVVNQKINLADMEPTKEYPRLLEEFPEFLNKVDELIHP